MNTWYQMWGKTYQWQISNAGGWFISVIFSMTWWFFKVPWLSITFPENYVFPGFPDPVGTLYHVWRVWKLHFWIIDTSPRSQGVNTLRPRQDGRHFADDIFICIFFHENCYILIKFSLKYVRKGPIDNTRKPALVQIMAWRRPGDKPLSETMMAQFTDAYMRHSASMS